ncbi:Hypothetical protein R9X50_00470000 [Acrodontium crateriforme]|uniref:Solute carrier family 40 member n=1 Tax=Acrodontium crateriforme TaxID=150365 RepID=A0AAQ3RAC3_9PEZI|nr:Hypothetical protein R9X50_00470000 [Acrodontium crateriforme]
MGGKHHSKRDVRSLDHATGDVAAKGDLLHAEPPFALELYDQAGLSRLSSLVESTALASGAQNGVERSYGENGYTQEPTTDAERIADEPVAGAILKHIGRRLYTSHLLSTWNSRLFEFGAVLFLASIFQGTLLPMSVYALVRSGAAILFAQSIGSWIDSGNRLTILRTSIIGQRLAVAASCGIFWALELKAGGTDSSVTNGLFSLVIILACVEKLCSVVNLVAVERDWVVVITEGNEPARRVFNARMRRIDLLCKLLGPLAISLIAMASILIAIWATLAMSLLSITAEYIFIAQVYKAVPQLRRASTGVTEGAHLSDPVGHAAQNRRITFVSRLKTTAYRILPISSLPFYFCHSAFLASFSLSLLYLTVLSFSGQMITYLISVGCTSLYVGIARTVSTVFELSATWIAPRLMQKIGAIRGGIWSLCWQMIWLAAGISWFFSDLHGMGTNSVAAATGLAVGVALSRVGLWGYDLCAQNIIQDEVDVDHRGTFSIVEAAFQNLFEMFSYTLTIIFSRPDQFQWPVIISAAAVYAAGGLYTALVRKRRGHLFHTAL